MEPRVWIASGGSRELLLNNPLAALLVAMGDRVVVEPQFEGEEMDDSEELCQYERWSKLGEDGDLFLKFENVANKRSKRPDLHAMLLLESIFPDREGDMICHAEHDQIWLDFGDEDSVKLTDDQIRELCMCGVWWDNGMTMFA